MSSYWKEPPRIKAYEALGAIVDGRVLLEGSRGRVASSSGGKAYDVTYDRVSGEITANDNGSYWRGYLGYPILALLIELEVLGYDERIAAALRGIAWKDVNVRFKNDFEKTERYIEELVAAQGIVTEALREEGDRIVREAMALKLKKLGTTAKPPIGY